MSHPHRIPCQLATRQNTLTLSTVVAALIFAAFTTCAATFTAQLEPKVIPLGEAATLTLMFEGGTPSEMPALPRIPGLTLRYIGPSTRFEYVNGRSSSSVQHSYQITADKPGTYNIPAVSVLVDGRRLTSQPLTLTVAQADNRTAQVAFLTLTLPRNQFFLGEAATADISLFAQGGRLAQAPQLSGEGFTFGTNFPAGEPIQLATNGAIYSRLTWRVVLTFVKTGNLQLRAGECLLDVSFRRPASRRDFFPFDFGEVDTRRLTLAAEPITVEVLPLPDAQRPPDFTGAVGDFTLSARLNTNVVTAGDPVTLVVQVTGTGALENLRWSLPTNWTRFKSYPPSTRLDPADPLGLTGTKTFEHVLVPESPDVREVPPVSFSFFHPLRRVYRTLTQPAQPLTVRPAPIAPAQPVVAASPALATPTATTDIVHIKNLPGPLAHLNPPLILRPAFVLLQLVPLALWIGARLWRRHQDLLAANPRLCRQRQVDREIRAALQRLREQAAQAQSEVFFATLLHILQEQIGERLDLPASAITGEIVESRLRSAGLNHQTLRELDALFQLCDQVRYAPQRTTAELGALIPRLEQALTQLRTLEVPRG